MKYKVGVYVRVSTDEQALRSEGSLETQKHRILGEIENRNRRESGWGKVVEIYEDDGYSAADYRPQYERLMADVRRGRVNMIFVADYFRFCRHLLDYLQLAEQLKEIGAKILSVKDNFDTETAMGQSMIRNYINMAQTERELTAERVTTNFHARALRGLRNGGRIIFGFERNDNDLARLEINEAEAAEIREVFRVYLAEGTCGKAADALNRNGMLRKTKSYKDEATVTSRPWIRNDVWAVLRNPAYAGLREINKKNKDLDQTTLKETAQYKLVPASWPAIVDETTWKVTQESLDFALAKERERLSGAKKRDFLLTGLLKCAECGSPLMGSVGHGTKTAHRYYRHRYVKGQEIKCSMDWVPADELEASILERLDRVLENQEYLTDLEVNLEKLADSRHADWKREKSTLEADAEKVEAAIRRTIKVQSQCEDLSVDDVFRDELRNYADQKRAIKVRLDELERQQQEEVPPKVAMAAVQINTAVFKKSFAKSKNVARKRLLGAVFDSVTLGNCEMRLHYWETLSSPEAVQYAHSKKSSGGSSEDSPQIAKVLNFSGAVRRARGSGPRVAPSWDERAVLRSVVKIGRGDRI